MIAPANPEPLPLALLRETNQALSLQLGCLIPEDRMGHLSRVLSRAAARAGCSDAAALCRRIIDGDADPAVTEELAAELLPGETYFFRDQPSINALQELFPRLLQERRGERTLNIWSAACSTGEEPLTLAMLLHSSPGGLAGWNIRILATDLRARALAVARSGNYREWSFRDCPGWVRDRYFTLQSSGVWAIAPEILATVEYRQFNLVRDAFPPPGHPAGGFDLILCRNVLIYLDPRRIPSLLEQLRHCLADGGWLLVSAVEAPAVNMEGFECIRLGETLLFRKCHPVRRTPGEAAPAPEAPPGKPAATWSGPAKPLARRPGPPGDSCRPEHAEKPHPTPAAQHVGCLDVGQYLAQAAECLDLGDLAAARSLLRRALYLDRHHALAHLLQGRLHQAEGQDARARRSYQAALKLLERLAPGQELDHDRQWTAAGLAALIREMLNRLGDRC